MVGLVELPVRELLARNTIWQRIEDVRLLSGEILLSFDDGPNSIADTTARLLDVLQREDVRAAFCVCGKCVRSAPELVRRMMAEGHFIVNHGDRHQPLALFSEEAFEKEVRDCDAAIEAAVQIPSFTTPLFRPACGWWTPTVKHQLPRLKKSVLPITHFGQDTSMTRHTYLRWVERTRHAARRDQGGIFVLHDGRLRFWGEIGYDVTNQDSSAYRGWVPNAAAELIKQCRSDGFRFLDPHLWSQRAEIGR